MTERLLYELEYNSSAGVFALKNLYGWGTSGLLQRFDTRFGTGGDATTCLFDPSGSVVTRVDEAGKPLCVSAYDAFGFVRTDKNPNSSDLNRYSYPKSSAYSVGFGGQFGYYTENGTDLTPADGDDGQKGDRGLILCTHRYYDPARMAAAGVQKFDEASAGQTVLARRFCAQGRRTRLP